MTGKRFALGDAAIDLVSGRVRAPDGDETELARPVRRGAFPADPACRVMLKVPPTGGGGVALRGCEIGVIGAGMGGLAAELCRWRGGALGSGYSSEPDVWARSEPASSSARTPSQCSRPLACAMRWRPRRARRRRWNCIGHHGGRLVARVPLGQATEARYGRPYWHLHRADLLAAMTEGVVEAGWRGIRLGSRVEAVETDGRGLRMRQARSSTWW